MKQAVISGNVECEFNNILTGINSSSELLKEHIKNGHGNINECVDNILSSSDRACGLAKKILTEETSGETTAKKTKSIILLVDDESVIREAFGVLIEGKGYEVLTAVDGKDALEVFRQEKDNIDLVVLDIIMPNLSGPATFDELLKIKPDVKVLISTGYNSEYDIQEMLDKGARSYILKPYRIDALIDKISEILSE